MTIGARYVLHVPDVTKEDLSECRFYVVTEDSEVAEQDWEVLACNLDREAARILLPAIDYIVRRMEAAVVLMDEAESATLDVPDYLDEIRWEGDGGSPGDD